jgi:2-C-methyl-D-erythritol 4-phosphate cytidylyltransferase
MVIAGIVAGGKGTRMKNADKPKQFLEIGGEAILIRTVRAFYSCSEIDRIYIGINPDWHEYTDTLIEKAGFDCSRVRIIDGGSDRNSTVMKILSAATEENGCGEGDILVTHDGVRPFVTEKIIFDNIECAKKYSVCGTYIPSADTIVKSADSVTVSENLVRSELFRAQTPQSFDIGRLKECCEKLGQQTVTELTDTCGIFTACGIPIHIVEGDEINFKITTDYDLKIARLITEK